MPHWWVGGAIAMLFQYTLKDGGAIAVQVKLMLASVGTVRDAIAGAANREAAAPTSEARDSMQKGERIFIWCFWR
jgi:hypothetical protein